ncbi:hypothetical protein QQS21_006772 [Conoideocrella luteorostrata]|uniref:Maleylacetate reductase n=1 Tax=Conoideocrella luteorostrata TaxID=1105319 RepID=A0AAJ0FT39_9HYPO|nr:hypothetical protein QQS21_006772 [Conoideocrella luteorostrata]
MASHFVYSPNPARVIFGTGTLNELPAELSRLNAGKPLVLSTPGQASRAESISNLLQGKIAGIYSKARMHTPVNVTQEACEEATKMQADALVSIGGGSTIGLGKAVSFRIGLPHITIPTTYAGSEVTPVLGETENGVKTTKSDPKILPATVIYDVDLTLTLPAGLTATSGVNAMAHAIEGLYAQNTNPVIKLMALDGIRALAEALPVLSKQPSNKKSRESALYGAWLCGQVLGHVGMSIHHKLCHTLGGSFDLPHAQTHTVVLPHALSYNAPNIDPEIMAALAKALPGSEGDAVRGLNVLLKSIKVDRSLKTLGFKEEDIDKAAELALAKPYWNPRKVEQTPVRELIRRAWAGEDARADL